MGVNGCVFSFFIVLGSDVGLGLLFIVRFF